MNNLIGKRFETFDRFNTKHPKQDVGQAGRLKVVILEEAIVPHIEKHYKPYPFHNTLVFDGLTNKTAYLCEITDVYAYDEWMSKQYLPKFFNELGTIVLTPEQLGRIIYEEQNKN